MDFSQFGEFTNIVILGICLCAGYMIKNAVPTEKINRFIPLIMGTLGLVLAIISNYSNITLETILTGLISGLASTGVYEGYKNLLNKKEGN